MITHSGIKDSGAVFEIVPHTRKVKVPSAHKAIGVEGDYQSEQVTFKCPKVIDGHVITGCSDHYITWKNANDELGHDRLVMVGEDADNVLFTWNVSGNLAVKSGVVAFSVHFEDATVNGDILYRWSTGECKDCEILNCVNAAIGTYELIYVDGDTLHIADYTPVRDRTMMLESTGVIPRGTKLIHANGQHNVAEYASVEVSVSTNRPPVISVSESGLVTASDGTAGNVVTHQLSAQDDADFVADNIAAGKTIFGVTGTFKPRMTRMCVTLWSGSTGVVDVFYVTMGDNSVYETKFVSLYSAGESAWIDVVPESYLYVYAEYPFTYQYFSANLNGFPVAIDSKNNNLGLFFVPANDGATLELSVIKP